MPVRLAPCASNNPGELLPPRPPSSPSSLGMRIRRRSYSRLRRPRGVPLKLNNARDLSGLCTRAAEQVCAAITEPDGYMSHAAPRTPIVARQREAVLRLRAKAYCRCRGLDQTRCLTTAAPELVLVPQTLGPPCSCKSPGLNPGRIFRQPRVAGFMGTRVSNPTRRVAGFIHHR
ncbi:hypothetical protein PHYPSEUDO_004142 [Phytophthora pseudosyringae]|uniref:Uncharacterized protein n=1 Tax=Phytophthora pseudosyringae TaxID=221518 RepID=A0A8T1WHQ6_9STRA|nr:hypothetical protein PHYPSEUDO_004142 [Phytophthora pseudosyringae]